MKILNIVLAIIFTIFAYLNLNDPDWYLWIPVYLFAAYCCGSAAAGRYYPKTYLAGIAIYLLYALFLFFMKDGVWDWITKYNMQHIAETMQAEKPWIEHAREFFGLLIVTAALWLNYARYKKH